MGSSPHSLYARLGLTPREGALALPMDKARKALAGKPQRRAQLMDRINSAEKSLRELRLALLLVKEPA